MFNGGSYNRLAYNSSLVAQEETVQQVGGNFSKRRRRRYRQVTYKYSFEVEVIGRVRDYLELFVPVIGYVSKSLENSVFTTASKKISETSNFEILGSYSLKEQSTAELLARLSVPVSSFASIGALKTTQEKLSFDVKGSVKGLVTENLPVSGSVRENLVSNLSLSGSWRGRIDNSYSLEGKADIRNLILLGLMNIEEDL